MENIFYFGTSLKAHGHYTWDLSGDYMEKVGLLPKGTPFNPEELTHGLQKGETAYYFGGGYSVLAISGSCIDDKPGTKSVFWIKKSLSAEDLVKTILDNSHACEIISKLLIRFTIKEFAFDKDTLRLVSSKSEKLSEQIEYNIVDFDYNYIKDEDYIMIEELEEFVKDAEIIVTNYGVAWPKDYVVKVGDSLRGATLVLKNGLFTYGYDIVSKFVKKQ